MAELILVVVRVGVYDHGVVGIASSLDEAKAIAELAAAREPDIYHAFELRSKDDVDDDGEFSLLVASLTAPNRLPSGRRRPRRWVTPNA